MVSHFNQLQDEGLKTYDAVLQGAGDRLRTVLMTALLAILGLLPMALSHGIGSETQRPLAVVIIGGLVSATLLTMVLLPVLYNLFMGVAEPRGSIPALPQGNVPNETKNPLN
jgi:cobalt-zinc-cadmium resistance protein CzcA